MGMELVGDGGGSRCRFQFDSSGFSDLDDDRGVAAICFGLNQGTRGHVAPRMPAQSHKTGHRT